MMKFNYKKFIGAFLFSIGFFIFLNSFTGITGFVVYSSSAKFFGNLFCLIFIIGGLLILVGGDLEKKLSLKRTIIQKRKDGYFLYNTKNGQSYSLKEITSFSQDYDLKRELRRDYMPDLLRIYASSTEDEKEISKRFISALSPNSYSKNLDRRLKQFENVYSRIKDKLNFMNPKRLSEATQKDFSQERYVRFENERDTLWPKEGTIGFLPFDEVKVNRARGPLVSIISISQLVKDGYLLNSNGDLNPKWGDQKRQDYLKEKYGIDVGGRERNMILFQLEKGTVLQPFNTYDNVLVKDKVPLVKVIKKK